MVKNDQFYSDMQRYIAVTTLGPSTLRNQGSKGVIKAAQEFLASIDLSKFNLSSEAEFLRVLDDSTEELKSWLPPGAQNWGAARKAMNLFLRDICYNRFLCERCGLAGSEEWLELPLDNLVAQALKGNGRRGELPRWPGLNGLDREVSEQYQSFAKRLAEAQTISRVHLDMRLWTTERDKRKASGAVQTLPPPPSAQSTAIA